LGHPATADPGGDADGAPVATGERHVHGVGVAGAIVARYIVSIDDGDAAGRVAADAWARGEAHVDGSVAHALDAVGERLGPDWRSGADQREEGDRDRRYDGQHGGCRAGRREAPSGPRAHSLLTHWSAAPAGSP